MERVMASDMLGSRTTLPSDTTPGYIAWSPETDAAVQEETETETAKVTEMLR
ncbi:hypothetical protein A2U01_0069921, partial [Trifolium medium]|nr:hypothetical protein [Trifolium medium]